MIHLAPAATWATIAALTVLAVYGALAMGATAERIDGAIGRAAEWLGYDVAPEQENETP